jgi:hypothetical protein
METKVIKIPENHWDVQISVRYNLYRHYKKMNDDLLGPKTVEVKKEEKCIHTCGFANPNLITESDFNSGYDEFKQFLENKFEMYLKDTKNTIVV